MRRLRWLVLGLVVVVTVAAVGWWVVVPRWRPGLRAGEAYAVDVSAHQGRVDWSRVAADHVHVAYVKATEGADVVDPSFAANRDGAAAAGLAVTAYHFFGLCSPGDAQARNLLWTLGSRPLPVAVDLELAGNCAARPDAADVERQVRALLAAVEPTTGPALLYVGADFAARYPFVHDLGRPTWVRHLWSRPRGDWSAWQASDRARVAGVRGDVDLDVVRAPGNAPADS